MRQAAERSGAPLIVGFNRRFAPLAGELRALSGPRLMGYRVNAGPLPPEHWTNDLASGGGRLKGEGCHFIDFLCDQAGADPVSVTARGFGSSPQLPRAAADNFSVEIGFADGSTGTLHYAADAPAGPGKERFEVSAPGAFGVIDDFRSGELWRGRKRSRLGGRRQDKGFDAQYRWIRAVAAGEQPAAPLDGYVVSTLATLAAARALETGEQEPVVEGRLEAGSTEAPDATP